ncbi:uncharacterized protein [Leptinotarsa decemlineata]|uniref:uncharacterized protein n=1 Tax=Leptinotarsa decemlineata TaxID=7539 RepID=UPI003D305973
MINLSGSLFITSLFGLLLNSVNGLNLGASPKSDFQSRSAKLIDFDTENGIVKLDLQFGTSFLEIPVKPSLDVTKKALTKVNVGALLLTGIVTFVSAVILPIILSFFKQKFMEPLIGYDSLHTCQPPYRGLEQHSDMWRHLTTLDNVLLENGIDMTSCIQRLICSSVKKAANNVESGRGTSLDKIIDGVASNEWLLTFVNNTSIYTSVRNGLSNATCIEEYNNCKVSRRDVYTFMKRSGKLLNIWFN